MPKSMRLQAHFARLHLETIMKRVGVAVESEDLIMLAICPAGHTSCSFFGRLAKWSPCHHVIESLKLARYANRQTVCPPECCLRLVDWQRPSHDERLDVSVPVGTHISQARIGDCRAIAVAKFGVEEGCADA